MVNLLMPRRCHIGWGCIALTDTKMLMPARIARDDIVEACDEIPTDGAGSDALAHDLIDCLMDLIFFACFLGGCLKA